MENARTILVTTHALVMLDSTMMGRPAEVSETKTKQKTITQQQQQQRQTKQTNKKTHIYILLQTMMSVQQMAQHSVMRMLAVQTPRVVITAHVNKAMTELEKSAQVCSATVTFPNHSWIKFYVKVKFSIN